MRAEPWLDFGSDHSTFGKVALRTRRHLSSGPRGSSRLTSPRQVVWDTHVYVCNTNSPEWTRGLAETEPEA